MHKLITSIFGIGYIKGGGTIAAAVTCLVIYFLPAGTMTHPLAAAFSTLLIVGLGVYSSNQVEQYWGKDSYRVVIDEVAGMWITLLFVPVNITTLLIGLALFRFFDIVKPLYIKRMEDLPAGWGVMFDDVLAGIYGCVVFHLLLLLFPAIGTGV
ncbi:phosphatidylglycerophosphatase A family protein [Hufsiella ginkgonis]|uniref:Phosphatidylglycerophosphatase A n=1 Tax=Hufsiella ginkgonis TaxID=2695274 RepID=A0A7K1XW28_9SPHI|nr:phosphatidylglycerophosphatase A [Hufsiella ginkgonis]MXV14979.1 phosphatidylglycerophosphatase A [Hufsiella ginkgonis]